jgi:polysaccharide export outer membrane protein
MVTHSQRLGVVLVIVALAATGSVARGSGQAKPNPQNQQNPQTPGPGSPTGPCGAMPTGASATEFLIGVDDILSIAVMGDDSLSKEAQVRPDGKISLAYINDIQASGFTVEQFRQNLTKAISDYIKEPTIGVTVKQINSRKVFIMGEIPKPGAYPLTGVLTVSQLITIAGQPTEFADKKHILIKSAKKRPDGEPWSWEFNYDDFIKRRKMSQDRELEPGDTVIIRGS